MKLSCQIVQDLLPLYLDDVCSAESRAAVQAHLAECKTCRALTEGSQTLPQLDITPEAPAQEQAVRRSFRKVRRRWLASLLAVLMLLPLMGLCCLGWNQYHGTGICFSNLDDVWTCYRYIKAIENRDYEKAASYISFDALFEDCQEAINMQPADFMPDYTRVTIGSETWMVYSWFAQQYLSNTSDAQNTWAYLIYNSISEALIPEDIWREVTAYGEEPIPDGACYRLPDGNCYYRLETQWGNFMITDNIWDNLQQIGTEPVDIADLVAMIPEKIYLDILPELEARSLEYCQQIRERHADIIGMDLDAYTAYMKERYIQQLEALDDGGYTIESKGFRDAYYVDRWVISFAAKASDGENTQQFYFNLEMHKGKIHLVGFSYPTLTAWLDQVTDIFHPRCG